MKLFIVVILVLATGVESVEVKPRIMNGMNAKPTDFKYQVTLYCMDKNYNRSDIVMCGGSVISQNWILTAAHCFKNKTVAEIYLGLNTEYYYTEEVNATKVIPHKSYFWNATHVLNDIALVEIPTIQYGDFIQKIPLSNQTETSFVGQAITVAGWGYPKGTSMPTMLQYSNLRVLDGNGSREKLGIYLRDDLFCTFEPTSNVGSGDSGGPAVIGFGATAIQIGVVSYQIEDLIINTPTVYTRVASFLPWIKSKTNIIFA